MGSFTISLDFELYWGMRDIVFVDEYRENLLGVRRAIPEILRLFEEYQIHATWATVGFIKFGSFDEIELPSILPEYLNRELSPYLYIEKMRGTTDREILMMHFAPELIKEISETAHQEIATHTYSHYYIDEPEINPYAFKADIEKAVELFAEDGYRIESLILPRNHTHKESLEVLRETKIRRYRGNPSHWAYREGESKKSLFVRVYRLLDTYINLSGNHWTASINSANLTEIRSSMFLRPYSKRLRYLESLKIKRIEDAMSSAAKEDKNFHLWWHPHNFGVNLEYNLNNLEEILKHYSSLQREYGMKSLNMMELDL